MPLNTGKLVILLIGLYSGDCYSLKQVSYLL